MCKSLVITRSTPADDGHFSQGVRHVIACPSDASSWCSLVPLIEPSVVTTTGLKWNLTGEVLKFGQLISVSNEFSNTGGYVEVECSSSVLWSMKDSSHI